MKVLLLAFLLIFSTFGLAKGQDTLDYELVDAFRLDKKYSAEVLNFLIGKGDLTKPEIEEEGLNVFNYVYAVDIVDSDKLNDNGIYRFGIVQSHGSSYLLIKSNDKIDIISDLEPNLIIQKVDVFLSSNTHELGTEMEANYRKALDKWFSDRNF